MSTINGGGGTASNSASSTSGEFDVLCRFRGIEERGEGVAFGQSKVAVNEGALNEEAEKRVLWICFADVDSLTRWEVDGAGSVLRSANHRCPTQHPANSRCCSRLSLRLGLGVSLLPLDLNLLLLLDLVVNQLNANLLKSSNETAETERRHWIVVA